MNLNDFKGLFVIGFVVGGGLCLQKNLILKRLKVGCGKHLVRFMVRLMGFKRFIGKHHSALENAYGFDYYLEMYDQFKLGKNQDHKTMIEAFLKFVGKKDVTVLKMDNDVISDFIDVSRDDLVSNLYLLGDEKGLFFDEDWDISYAFAGEGFLPISCLIC